MKSFVRLFAALAAALLGVTLLSAPISSSASPTPSDREVRTAPVDKLERSRAGRCRPPYCFGAISMSPDQAYGLANERSSRSRAVRAAHRRCKAQSNYPGFCQKMGSIGNGCMAVAIRVNSNGWITHWKTGFGRTKYAAKRQALRRNNGGRIRTWLCTSRRY